VYLRTSWLIILKHSGTSPALQPRLPHRNLLLLPLLRLTHTPLFPRVNCIDQYQPYQRCSSSLPTEYSFAVSTLSVRSRIRSALRHPAGFRDSRGSARLRREHKDGIAPHPRNLTGLICRIRGGTCFRFSKSIRRNSWIPLSVHSGINRLITPQPGYFAEGSLLGRAC
jgi:hypothetical protein